MENSKLLTILTEIDEGHKTPFKAYNEILVLFGVSQFLKLRFMKKIFKRPKKSKWIDVGMYDKTGYYKLIQMRYRIDNNKKELELKGWNIEDINKKLMKDLEDIAEFGFKRLQQLENEQPKNKALNIANVSGDADDFEKDLGKLITDYVKIGLKKIDLVKKMEWMTGNCKFS